MANYKDQFIVVSGGFVDGGRSSEIYSIASDSWAKAPDLNEYRSGHSTSTHGTFVYIMGGL